ncbi:RHS repeat domain-containing protein [Ralstonia sp. NFACC01]|uniref:RHS repeat domain-containing protein n=1 Tax=Ralstonia sp. NFACC01 TaxID=1566294 RepID=UPI0015875F01|nr:RHS repeat domain-containing protein [Ralstonia sp. NFACC01]
MFIGDDGYLSQTVEGICVPAHSPKTMSTGWGEYDVVGSKVSGPNSCELSLVVRVPSEWSSPRTLTRGWPVYTQLACPDGSLTPDNVCTPRPPVQACTVAYPVIPGTGTKILVENDSASAELPLTRAYRSFVTFGINAGTGKWLFNWQRALDTNIARFQTPQVSAWRDDGSILYFQKNGAVWSTASSSDTLQAVIDGNGATTGWLYKVGQTGVVETYDADGRLQSVRERNGRTTQLAYDASKRLTTVTAPSGRALTFAYDASGRVATVTAPDGAVTKYAYNASGMLTTVTWPDNNIRQYVYENTRFPTALTGVIDEAGVRYTTYAYDDRGRAISSEVTPASDRYQFQYPSNGQTIVTLPSGTTSTYTFLQQNGVLLPTGVSAPCPTCGSTAQSTSYDSNNNPTSKIGYDGSATSYSYDSLGRETLRVEGAGTANAKTTTTEWDPQQWLVTRVAAPNKIEVFSYDANGNLLSYTLTPTNDANGEQGFSAPASGAIKRTDWTYDNGGLALTATERTDGVATGTWTFTYDGNGNLQTLTNPDGKTGRITLYDAAGRVLEATDVNGIAIKLSYNSRGWVTAYDYGEQHIRYEYDAIGQRTAMVGPQNLVMRYVYDAAHRLTQILDNIPTAQSDTHTQTASPFATSATQRSRTQSIGDMVRHGWNAMLAWMKKQLAGLIASAHAQVIPAPGAGGLVLPPIPNVSLPIKGPQYPEDNLDPNAGAVMSKTRPPGMSSLEERHYDRTCANSQDPCVALKASAQKAIAQAKVKMNNMLYDTMLYKYAYDTPNPAVTGTNTTWKGHADDLDGRISNIWAMISLGRKMGCDMSAETAAAMTLLTPGAPL